ncbi:hypothetical protein AUC61_12685 [Pseudomonas sp. S25]|uniref:Glucosyl transferase GtrII n=1 Tax=Pseudomonas maioricensis TaxID=1766623 RepID=A0ABS9ZIN0_9PSED|nr:hypothetical protein [Pseudomonas sp. S25]MCI8210395.1 hypothetical protein [Pseudomonas sp. S25]
MAGAKSISSSGEAKFLILAGVLYALMHGGILFIPSAVFWDDWVTFETSASVTLENYRQAGAFFNLAGYLHIGLTSLGLWSYKVLTFVLMGGSGFFLNAILKRNGVFGIRARYLVVLLFMLLPFNLARVAMIDFPYSICYALFFAAWLAMDRYRVLAAALFFLSFNSNSLLVFYALPMLDLLYRTQERYTLNGLWRFFISRWELFFIPFLYFGMKTMLFKPEGFYAGYNQGYSLIAIPLAIKAQLKDVVNLKVDFAVMFCMLVPVYYALRRQFFIHRDPVSLINFTVLFGTGFLALVLGGIPYWILGYIPTFLEWTSRHQLLMPLGVALIMTALLTCATERVQRLLISLILSACISYGVVGYVGFYVDWQKQKIILSQFKHDPLVARASFVIIDDQTKQYNAIHRNYRFYEWNGMLTHSLGDESRFAVEVGDVDAYRSGKFDDYFSSLYKAGAHRRRPDERAVVVTLRKGEGDDEERSFTLLPKIVYSSRPLSSEVLNGMNAATRQE